MASRPWVSLQGCPQDEAAHCEAGLGNRSGLHLPLPRAGHSSVAALQQQPDRKTEIQTGTTGKEMAGSVDNKDNSFTAIVIH